MDPRCTQVTELIELMRIIESELAFVTKDYADMLAAQKVRDLLGYLRDSVKKKLPEYSEYFESAILNQDLSLAVSAGILKVNQTQRTA